MNDTFIYNNGKTTNRKKATILFLMCVGVGFVLMSSPEDEAAAGGVVGQAWGGAVIAPTTPYTTQTLELVP
jgi:hypothetical protein